MEDTGQGQTVRTIPSASLGRSLQETPGAVSPDAWGLRLTSRVAGRPFLHCSPSLTHPCAKVPDTNVNTFSWELMWRSTCHLRPSVSPGG